MRHSTVTTLLLLVCARANAQQPGFGALANVIAEHCSDCHGADGPKGLLDLDARARAEPLVWLATLSRVRDRVAAGEMPPPGREPALTAAARAQLVAFCVDTLARDVPRLPSAPARVTVRRLTRTHWENSVRDLLGVQSALCAAFPADDLGYGFDSIGDALSFSTLHLEKYLAASADVAAQVFDGEDPAAPTVRRIEAERMRLVAGPGASMDGEVAGLYANATLAAPVRLPRDGVYKLRIAAGADQAGTEPARMAIAIDGRELEQFDVPHRELRTLELTLPVTGGERRVAIAFVNDYWDPQNADPTRRDRNLRVDWLEVVGPIDARPPVPQRAWLLPIERATTAPAERLRALAAELLPRAWRRPVTAAEIERTAAVGTAALARGEPLFRAQQRVLQAALASPSFLFRAEPVGALPEWARAVRLAFFVWGSGPDDALRTAAARGELAAAEGRRAQLQRLLADPRADALATDFAAQWLELRSLDARMPDPARFPCDRALKVSMRRETELLFRTVLREGLDVRALLDVDFTFVDRRLAAFYGLPGAFGDEFVRVVLPPALRARGGVLGHASVLAVTSNPTRTSPVKRGKWILENLLGQAPPPPPPGNDSLKNEAAAATPKGFREQLELHRHQEVCASCHRRMDALGFALERFDPIGRLRERDEHGAIDDNGELPDGRRLAGLTGLKQALLQDPAFARTVARKLFVYAVGRDLTVQDRLQLDLAVDALRARGVVTLAALVGAVADSDAFVGAGGR